MMNPAKKTSEGVKRKRKYVNTQDEDDAEEMPEVFTVKASSGTTVSESGKTPATSKAPNVEGKRSSKKPAASGNKTRSSTSQTVNTQEDTEEMPEELTNEAVFKMMRIEEKRIRDSVPNNPYRRPDKNAKWTDKDREDYFNWLTYKRGHLGLTRSEEDEMTSIAINKPTNSKKQFE